MGNNVAHDTPRLKPLGPHVPLVVGHNSPSEPRGFAPLPGAAPTTLPQVWTAVLLSLTHQTSGPPPIQALNKDKAPAHLCVSLRIDDVGQLLTLASLLSWPETTRRY